LTGNELLLCIFAVVYRSLLMSSEKDLCIWTSLSNNVIDSVYCTLTSTVCLLCGLSSNLFDYYKQGLIEHIRDGSLLSEGNRPFSAVFCRKGSHSSHMDCHVCLWWLPDWLNALSHDIQLCILPLLRILLCLT